MSRENNRKSKNAATTGPRADNACPLSPRHSLCYRSKQQLKPCQRVLHRNPASALRAVQPRKRGGGFQGRASLVPHPAHRTLKGDLLNDEAPLPSPRWCQHVCLRTVDHIYNRVQVVISTIAPHPGCSRRSLRRHPPCRRPPRHHCLGSTPYHTSPL